MTKISALSSGAANSTALLPAVVNSTTVKLTVGDLVSGAVSTALSSNTALTSGSMWYGDSSGKAARLAIGSSGSILQSTAGTPTWKASTAVLAETLTAAGDLLVRSTAGIARLAGGNYGQYLGMNSSADAPAWTANNGWIGTTATWTYATSNTFTTPQSSATFPKGTKIQLTNNSSVAYFYVTGTAPAGSSTTVTITGGSDYQLANAAITSPFYSYASNPQGFPQWFNYSVTLTAGTGTLTAYTVNTAVFTINGRTVVAVLQITLTTNGTGGTDLRFTLPVSISPTLVNGAGRENALTGKMLQIAVASPTLGLFNNYDNTYPGQNGALFYLGLTAGF